MKKNTAWDIIIILLTILLLSSIALKQYPTSEFTWELKPKNTNNWVLGTGYWSLSTENNESAAKAYYELAEFYHKQKDYQKALAANHEGLSFAEEAQNSEILFRLFRQNGDIRLAKGEKKKAISVYGQAVRNLRFDRRSVPIENNLLLFKLKEEANSFLREYIQLLLESNRVEKAIEVLSVFKLSEFQAFFSDPCFEFMVDRNETRLNLPKNSAIKEAIIYSFITSNYTYLIVKKTGLSTVIRRSKIGLKELNNIVINYRQQLQEFYVPRYQNTSILLYNLLIEPIMPDLKEIEKITFIQDGILRTIPMESLNDGKQYLLEKFTIDYASGLSRRSTAISHKFGLELNYRFKK